MQNKEIAHIDFKIPLKYQKTYPIENNLVNDLELFETQNPSNKAVVNYLFNPTNELGKKSLSQWDCYTADTNFLTDSQKLYNNINKLKENHKIIDDMIKTWKEVKTIQNFDERFQYIEWDRLAFLNTWPVVMYILSFLNITAPLMQLIAPIMAFILPFFLLKAAGLPITIGKYKEILTKVISTNALYRLFTDFKDADIKKKLTMIFTVGLYFYNLYQNLLSCYRFYINSFYIIEKIKIMKHYLKYTIDQIDCFKSNINKYPTYSQFNSDIEHHKIQLEALYNNLNFLPEKFYTSNTIPTYGYIMKYFYDIYNSDDINNLIEYSFSFNGYINNIIGIRENINNNSINQTTYSNKNKAKIKQVYHPTLSNECIKNNIDFNKSIILTGPNAAGKTTLLKSTIINILFSQQVGYGFYKSCELNPFDYFHCYINIPDSVSRDSLFQAEVRRCKDILNVIETQPHLRHFCVFDELYSGTNPYEAISSAYSYLNHITKNKNIKFVLTTHYIKLCHLFKKHKQIKNYKMKVKMTDEDKPIYSYKINKGISKIKGGISILRDLQYPNDIILEAKNILNSL
jgi:actin-related protein